MLLNFKRSAAILYKSIESTESGPEQGKVIKCNRVFADCPIRKQRFDNLIFVVDYLKHFSRFRRRILMLIAVSLMGFNVLQFVEFRNIRKPSRHLETRFGCCHQQCEPYKLCSK